MITPRYPLVPAGDDDPFLPPEKDSPDVVHDFWDAKLAFLQCGPPGLVAADLGDRHCRNREGIVVESRDPDGVGSATLRDTGPGPGGVLDPVAGVRGETPRLSFFRRLWHDTFGWDPEEWHQ
jgi:hypothetical protein